MRLCSTFDEEHKVVCDLPLGHLGPHTATVVWGDDDDEEDDE